MAVGEVVYKVVVDAKSGEASLQRFSGETAATEQKFESLKKTLSRGIKTGIAIAGGQQILSGVQSLLGGISDAALQFDTNIRNIGSLGVSNFRQIGDELLDLSKRIPKDAGDLANATYQAISAGIDPTKTVGFVEQAAKVAVAGQATTEAAVNGLTSVLNAYKLKTEEAGTVSDQFFGAIKFGKTTFNELNSGIANVVPTAASLGIGFDQVTAAIAAMTNQGVPTVQSTTQIRQAMVELQKPGKELEQVMRKAGVSVEDLKNPNIGLIGVLQAVQQEAQKQGKSMAQVFSSVEAGSAALLLSGENYAAAAQQLENVRGAAGASGEAFEVLNESFENQLQLLKNYVTAGLMPVARVIVGGIIGGIKGLISVFTASTNFISQNRTAFIALGAAVGLLAISMNAATISAGLATKAKVIWAATTGGVTTAMKVLNATMKANPIGLLITGITTAIAVFSMFSTKVKSVEDATADVKSSIENLDKVTAEASGMKKQADSTDELARRYDELKSKSSLTAIEQIELEKVTKDLDAATGGAATTVDNYGNIVGIATDKVRGMTDEQRKLSAEMQKIALQDVTDNMDGLAATIIDTEKNLNELRNDLKKADAGMGTLFTGAKDRALELRKEIRTSSAEFSTAIKEYAEGLVNANYQNVTLDKLLKEGFSESTANRILTTYRSIIDARKQQSANDAADAEAAKKVDKEKKTREEDLLALAKRLAQEKTQQYEIDRKLALLQQGKKFTLEEELNLQRQANANLQEQISKANLLSNKKYAVKAQIELNTGAIKELELKAKLVVELDKLKKQIESGLESISKSEIEIGIKPRSEGIRLIEDRMKQLQSEIDKTTTELEDRIAKDPLAEFDSTGLEIKTRLINLRNDLLASQKSYRDQSAAIGKELSDLRIDTITDEQQRELAILNKQFEEKMQFVRDAIENERELDADEKTKKRLLELKYQQDLLALRKKYATDAAVAEVNISQALYASLSAGLKRFDALRRQMSESEIARNQFEFDKRRSDLQSALSRGEISEREYRLRIRALDEERARFELENNATIWQRIIEGGKSMLSAMADAYTSYFENLAQKYITDVVLNEQAERDKQAAAAETANANSASGDQSAAGAVKAGNANIFAAASQIAGKAIASLPFPVNIGASIAAAFLISKTLQGIRSVLGFARGGLGIVGEAGTPEFIGPAKDFSQYSTNLALSTSRETYRAIRDALRSTDGRRSSDQRVRIDGKVRASGREFDVVLQNELISRRSELAVAA